VLPIDQPPAALIAISKMFIAALYHKCERLLIKKNY
jgi:hypothetical protein